MSKATITGSTIELSKAMRSGKLAAAAAAVVLSFNSFGQAAVAPITATGYNSRNVYNSTGQTELDTFDAQSGNGYSLYSSDAPFAPDGTGLPIANNNTFTSASNPNTTFQFQPYTSSVGNALELNNNSAATYPSAGTSAAVLTSATLTLSTPAAYPVIAILSADSNGPTTVSYTVNFVGGLTDSGTFGAQDYITGTGTPALGGLGNIQRVYEPFVNLFGSSAYNDTTNAGLFEDDIALPSVDALLPVSSITFSIPSTGVTQYSVYAISGGTSPVPEPATLGVLGVGAVGLLSSRRQRRNVYVS